MGSTLVTVNFESLLVFLKMDKYAGTNSLVGLEWT
jgi:hypothetical protein